MTTESEKVFFVRAVWVKLGNIFDRLSYLQILDQQHVIVSDEEVEASQPLSVQQIAKEIHGAQQTSSSPADNNTDDNDDNDDNDEVILPPPTAR